MKFVVSRFNQDISWLKDYTNDVVLYDRSKEPAPNSIVVPNIGSDIYDKYTYIIDNYENLPDIAVYTKANLFKYCPKEEFDVLYKNAQGFTPLLTQNHRTYSEGGVSVCFYQDKIYFEINNYWYLGSHPMRDNYFVHQIAQMMGFYNLSYVPFAPGSNYILTKENILQHPKSFYEQLRKYLEWNVYPGEAQLEERGLYSIWKPK